MNDSNEDPLKREGHLELKITKFSEFTREKDRKLISEPIHVLGLPDAQRLSEPVHVLGLQWKIVSTNYGNQKLNCFLRCFGQNRDRTWACAASFTLKLLAQKEGKKDYVCQFRNGQSQMFSARVNGIGFGGIMSFEELMDPENGWYDEVNDCIILTMDFMAQALRGISYVSLRDVLRVNGKEVKVNKHHLAFQSYYFDRYFFGEEYGKESTDLLIDPPATVDLFKRMIETMQPQNRPLDDECLEGIYHLANQFGLEDLEAKCRDFLHRKSIHSVMFKYRLADKYGFPMLKEEILRSNVKKRFSKESELGENREEYAKLDEQAREMFGTRLVRMFGRNIFSEDEEPAEEPSAKRARATD